ncbi:hypothetical protein GCM10010425_75840 [Streptomyces spororaveus]|uniref:Uncharacterized protein n=1 Tax=Streptomyces spororaveus TaxID=284039 RepID=A0ABQ3T3K5_9ACTN|nr:hypothetical protein Sspor_05360 [Streptomyces spororaveus]
MGADDLLEGLVEVELSQAGLARDLGEAYAAGVAVDDLEYAQGPVGGGQAGAGRPAVGPAGDPGSLLGVGGEAGRGEAGASCQGRGELAGGPVDLAVGEVLAGNEGGHRPVQRQGELAQGFEVGGRVGGQVGGGDGGARPR